MAGSRLEEAVEELGPASVLDVGCGCGRDLTHRLARHAARVIAIDIAPHADDWRGLARSAGIAFCRMDGTALGFAGDRFPLVLERAALHHIARWRVAVAEMIRVSSDRVLIEEPVDDLRSPAKRRTHAAQEILLELQQEVGYPHYLHLQPEETLSAMRPGLEILTVELERHDAPVTFEEFFHSFDAFAARSGRPAYWFDRLRELRSRFGGQPLCEDDILTVLAAKRRR